MNPDLIKSREDALALVDADLITIRDFVMLCGFKGWDPVGDTVARTATDGPGAEEAGGQDRVREVGRGGVDRPVPRAVAPIFEKRRARSRGR